MVKKDEGLDSGIKKIVEKELETFKSSFGDELDMVKKVAGEKSQEYEDAIREKPLEWVAGAFFAGLLLGKLLSR